MWNSLFLLCRKTAPCSFCTKTVKKMNEGWLELESDPGLFTLLVQEFGVEGIQVEEIYDLQKPVEGPVYGFIFLFKWIEERRARRKVSIDDEACVRDEGILKEMFFAHQVVPDSCATHALLSILLNCPSDVRLGKMLAEFKDFTRNFTPESKGYAIGNMPEIARVHNSHAHPEPPRLPEKQSSGLTKTTSGDTFHFVSYVPIRDRLFELDGLKPYPIDHGPWGDTEDWTEKFRRVIAERLENEGGESDIRFNLMAVVSDRLSSYEQKLNTLRTNRQIIHQAIQRLIKEEQKKIEEIRQKEAQKLALKEKPKPEPEEVKKEIKVEVKTEVKREVKREVVSVEEEKIEQPSDKPANQEEAVPPKGSMEPPADPVLQGSSAQESSIEESSDTVGEELHHHRHKKKKKKKKHHKSKKKDPEDILLPARTPALDNHNYAKSLPSADDASSASTESEMDVDPVIASDVAKQGEASTSSESRMSDVAVIESSGSETQPAENRAENKAHTASPSTNLNPVKTEKEEQDADNDQKPSDIAKPLTVQTLFDKSITPTSSPFSNYSTDSASEVGSAFNSPIRSLNHSRANSPTSVKVSRFQQWKASSYADERRSLEEVIGGIERDREQMKRQEDEEASRDLRKRRLDSGGKELRSGLVTSPTVKQPKKEDQLAKNLEAGPELDGVSPFTPRQLLEMMQSVEDEIQQYEQRIQDEKEKRTKYKIDDCRRTHNYDPFLFTFLSMLAEQGKLNALIEKHSQIKSRPGINKLPRRQSTTARSRKQSGDKVKRRNSKNR